MNPTLTFAGLSDIGRIRARNEDHLVLVAEHGIAVVADGMGGHPGGDVASRITAEVVARRLVELLRPTSDGEQGTAAVLGHAMAESVLDAHALVRMEAARKPELARMGTTVTALAVDRAGGAYAIGHVGDSRAYLLRDGELRQLTKDDTWVQERVDAGDFTVEQGKNHPLGHLLTQCVGLEDAPEPQIIVGTCQPGDAYLLCTDGVTGALAPPVLEQLLRDHLPDGTPQESPEAVVRTLVEQAKERGATDNLTAALVLVA
ncbi:MAG TPA: protein phosphatase 2C domain-containing protein [Longimicrobiales bacterium]|nr:protein phosphatase 2C domain-containing protein [Longimicrobiales bacterium]